MKIKNLITTAVSLSVMLIYFSSCKKDLQVMEPTPSPVQVTAMADMEVNEDFDWKTVKTVQVEILPNANAVLYIKASDGSVYHKALIRSGRTYFAEITLPSYATEVTIELAGQKRIVPVNEGRVVASFD